MTRVTPFRAQRIKERLWGFKFLRSGVRTVDSWREFRANLVIDSGSESANRF
jgi:hypothetical protein